MGNFVFARRWRGGLNRLEQENFSKDQRVRRDNVARRRAAKHAMFGLGVLARAIRSVLLRAMAPEEGMGKNRIFGVCLGHGGGHADESHAAQNEQTQHRDRNNSADQGSSMVLHVQHRLNVQPWRLPVSILPVLVCYQHDERNWPSPPLRQKDGAVADLPRSGASRTADRDETGGLCYRRRAA
jgi:hypothetical protein